MRGRGLAATKLVRNLSEFVKIGKCPREQERVYGHGIKGAKRKKMELKDTLMPQVI
jgi:hypothetical protein